MINKAKDETIIISLGGSLIVPDDVDTEFLKAFRDLILSQVKQGKRFIVITGGGKTARIYIDKVKEIANPTEEDLDWVGISFTRLNAQLLRLSFGEFAEPKIILDPDLPIQMKNPVALGGGWKPGNSSDLAAVHVAISAGSKKVVNLSNIDYVYDKDPNKYPDAVKIEESSWANFRKILPEKWEPGLNSPFDPVAAEKAESAGIEVDILNGKNISNLEKCLNGESFIGTRIK